MSAPALRPATQDDAPRLAALHALAFDAPWDAAALAGLIGQPFVLALQAGEPAAGFILVQAVAGEAEILTLAVAPVARRRGLARALLEAAATLARARGAEAMWLEVAADNAPAQSLYLGAGFAEAGRRPRYYARPDGAVDALVLKRPLNSGPA